MDLRTDQSATVVTDTLTKRYGDSVAVDGLNLQLRPGEVYGLLGPNGAGKTTVLKILLGLLKPTAGSARVLGGQPGHPAVLARIGALIEHPSFYPYLSGRDNLRVLARYSRVAPSQVEQAIEQVRLSGRAKDKVKRYSLGMKQRLGVAAALLKDPALLVLDEPTNGLDPKGMSDMRTLIRKMGRDGRTVLLSSHLLGEVEQTCDRIGVIHKGMLIAEESISRLRANHGFIVRVSPMDAAQQVARRLPEVQTVKVLDGALLLAAPPERAASINAQLVSAGLRVSEMRPAQRSLEEVFLELTSKEVT
jgi:ABC-2 type transport system ATP-binding protein